MLLTAHIRDLATRYWELMHSPRTRRLGCEVMAGRYQVVDPSCANTATVRYLRNRLCAALGLDRCVAQYWLDDLSQYRDVCHFMCAIQNYLEEKEEKMSEFPELKPLMLVKCRAGKDIYTYYLIAGKLDVDEGLYEAYKLIVSSTGGVSLSELTGVGDLAERAVAVYAGNGPDLALAPGAIVRIAENDSVACACRIVWQRENPPLEVTMEEVCKKFGRDVKIVKGVNMSPENTAQYPPVYKIAVKCDGKHYWLEWFYQEAEYVGHYFDFMLSTGRKDDLEYLSQKEVYTLEDLQKVMRHARRTRKTVYVPGSKRYVPLKDLELTPVMVERFAPVE